MIWLLLISVSAHNVKAGEIEDPLVLANASLNWTSCEQFLEGTNFNETSILDIQWRIFYMWNTRYEDSYQAIFSLPAPTLIDRFRSLIERKTNKKSMPQVNWNETAFFLETTIDLSALFFRTDTPGIYHVIPSLIFEYDEVDPELMFAMKLVEPGYLGIMNCNVKVCLAFAPINKMPKDNQLEQAAKLFNVSHPFGFPYNVQETDSDLLKHKAMETNDDVEDEEEVEVAMHENSLL